MGRGEFCKKGVSPHLRVSEGHGPKKCMGAPPQTPHCTCMNLDENEKMENQLLSYA